MQFRILPVAVALLAVVLVYSATADPPTVDIAHAKCHHHHDGKHWIAENEEVDEEAMKTAFPANYEAMGWRKYKSGKCTYKRSYVDCPHKHHWHHDEDHWDHHYGYKKIDYPCAEDDECCSNNCANIGNATVERNVCCWKDQKPTGANCTKNYQCCSHKCTNSTGTGLLCEQL